MALGDFLSITDDEDARIEAEINDGASDYNYLNFWLSNYRSNLDVAKHYKNSFDKGVRFSTREIEF